MILLPPDLRFALRANDIERRAAARDGKAEPDPVPVVKFFNPLGAATWLASELDADGDTLFGLADLGFSSAYRLSVWAERSRRAGSILWAETLLRRAASNPANDELPLKGG
jgi:hypothetical protein